MNYAAIDIRQLKELLHGDIFTRKEIERLIMRLGICRCPKQTQNLVSKIIVRNLRANIITRIKQSQYKFKDFKDDIPCLITKKTKTNSQS